jgi:hypothetical protein
VISSGYKSTNKAFTMHFFVGDSFSVQGGEL